MAALSGWMQRFREATVYYVRGLVGLFTHRNIFVWAQAVAFKVLVTIVPVLILATGIFALILKQDRPFRALAGVIADLLPGAYSARIIDFLQQLQAAGDTLTVIGGLALILSAITLFTTLRIVIQGVFQEDWHEQRSILRGYAFDLRMAATVGLLFIMTFGLTLAMSTLNAAGLELVQKIGLDYVWLEDGWRRTFKFFGLLIPFLLSTTMFGLLYYFIPKPHPPGRSVLVGAVLAALLWEGAKSGFTWYATNVGRFDRYSSGEVGISAVGDTFGLIIAFVFWVYFSGLVLIIGALVTLLHEKRRREENGEEAPAASEVDEDRPSDEEAPPEAPADQRREIPDREEESEDSPSSSSDVPLSV